MASSINEIYSASFLCEYNIRRLSLSGASYVLNYFEMWSFLFFDSFEMKEYYGALTFNSRQVNNCFIYRRQGKNAVHANLYNDLHLSANECDVAQS